jgi:hypothetical protein
MVLDEVPNVLGVLIVNDRSLSSGNKTYWEVLQDLSTNVDEMRHVAHGCTKGSSHTVVQWESKDRIHPSLFLPVCRKVHVVGINLSDTEDARGTAESGPEIASDVLGCVDSDTVDSEFLDVFGDPFLELRNDIGVFGVDIH